MNIVGIIYEYNPFHLGHKYHIDATKELLADERFAACGASMIVNLLHITTAKTDMVTFRDGKTISMSKKLIAEIRTKWYEYWLGGQEDTL